MNKNSFSSLIYDSRFGDSVLAVILNLFIQQINKVLCPNYVADIPKYTVHVIIIIGQLIEHRNIAKVITRALNTRNYIHRLLSFPTLTVTFNGGNWSSFEESSVT